MKKFINIFIFVMLVCGVVLYALNLEHSHAVANTENAEYDSAVAADIAAALKEKDIQDIISANHQANDEAMSNATVADDIQAVNTIFDNFFDVYDHAKANHDKSKNIQITVNSGSAKAVGSFGNMAVTITGNPYGVIQRNGNGEAYFQARMLNMVIPYLPGTSQEMNNRYYCSGSKYWATQFYIDKSYTKKGFKEQYSWHIGDLISDITPETVNVESFSYDKFSERYTAKITFKRNGNEVVGQENYKSFLGAATENIRTGRPDVTVRQKTITFIISKNCQFLALASNETWHGDMVWEELHLRIKVDLDLSLLWTFSYPRTLTVTKMN